MMTIVTNEDTSSQDTGWYCFNCGAVWVEPAGLCPECSRRIELAKGLHISGLTAVPDPCRERRSQERVYVRLMANLQNYGYLVHWGTPDVHQFSMDLDRTVGAVRSALRTLVKKGWVETRKVGANVEYRIALHPAK